MVIRTMGNLLNRNKEQIKVKKGDLFRSIKGKMRPLDLLLFKGDDFVSGLISKLERRGNAKSHAGDFTHAGIVVNSDILDEPLLEPGKLYILESTISGKLGSGVPDIHGRSFLGIQIRDLEVLISAYDHPNSTSIAWCPLVNNPIEGNLPLIKQNFSKVYHEINGIMWDANCWSLLSALYPWMRPCRGCIESSVRTKNWLFCSEMVATVYKYIGIYPDYVDPKDVVPADFIYPQEDTDRMPVIIREITYVTSDIHYSVTESKIDCVTRLLDNPSSKLVYGSCASSSNALA